MSSYVLGDLLREVPLLPAATSVSCPGSQWVAFLTLIIATINNRQSAERAVAAMASSSLSSAEDEYDVVVVGGGSSGCVIASRLSEGGQFRVLLLERGGTEPQHVRVPGFMLVNLGSDLVENIHTVADPHNCNGTGCVIPIPRVLGGGSSMNAMMYMRGNRQDYNNWADMLNDNAWRWDNVLPYFKKLENNLDIAINWDTDYHSTDGPQKVSWQPYRHPALYRLSLGLDAIGITGRTDVNGRQPQIGHTVAQTFTANGERWSAYRSYVEPVLERPNLRVETFATARRLLLKKDADGVPRAEGVEYVNAAGQIRVVRARKQVVLTAGALHTPQILLMSGIGPADHLQELGVPQLLDLPVGLNLMDHARVNGLLMTCSDSICKVGWERLKKDLRQYGATSDGPASSAGFAMLTAYARVQPPTNVTTAEDALRPDTQLFFAGVTEADGPEECQQSSSWRYNRISIVPALLHPKSRGSVRLNASDPYGTPIVDLGYLTDAEGRDLDTLVRSLRLAVDIAGQLKSNEMRLVRNASTAQGCQSVAPPFSDAYLACLARRTTDTLWHFSGTCAMGRVTDSSLRVRGVRGLRVADASAMPSITSGNTNAPVLMIAERAAVLIRAELAVGG